jgi:hypothetical protein
VSPGGVRGSLIIPSPDPKRESIPAPLQAKVSHRERHEPVHFVLLFIGSTTTRANERVFISRRRKPHYAFLDLHLLMEALASQRALDIMISCRVRARCDKMQAKRCIARRRRARIRSTVALTCKIPLLKVFLSEHFLVVVLLLARPSTKLSFNLAAFPEC